MGTTQENLSPVIDLDRKSVVAFANRVDNIDSSSDVYPTSDLLHHLNQRVIVQKQFMLLEK